MKCWNDIETQADIDRLLSEYGDFHDACITGLQYEAGSHVNDDLTMGWDADETYRLVLFLQRQWRPRNIELCFTGVRRLNLSGCDTRFFTMDSCYLSFCDSYIVWADGEEFDPKRLDVNKLRGDMYTFIVADHLRWRFGEN